MTSKAIKCLKHHFVMLKLGILVKCHDRCTYALPWNADSNMSYELITFTHIVARLKHSNDTPFFFSSNNWTKLLFGWFWGFQCSQDCFIKDIFQSLLCQGRAFHIFHTFQLTNKLLCILNRYGFLFILWEFFYCACVIP